MSQHLRPFSRLTHWLYRWLLLFIAGWLGACSTPTVTPPAVASATPRPALQASPTPASGTLVIYCDSSLEAALDDLQEKFQASHPAAQFSLQLAGSQELVQQMIQGDRPDLFISADRAQMDAAIQNGLVDAAAAQALGGSKLVVIMPQNNPAKIETIADLARTGVKLALAAADAPLGADSRSVLERAAASGQFGQEYTQQVLANVTAQPETDPALVDLVIQGKVDAGITYLGSAMRAGPTQVSAIEIPEEIYAQATYYFGVLTASQQAGLAQQFIDFIFSEVGQELIIRSGLIPVQ